MPLITLAYSTSLAEPITATATTIRVAPNQADLCETVGNLGKNVVLTIFNAKYSELVLATGCQTINGIPYVTVQRGFGGTTARDWAYGSCVCTSNIVDACAAAGTGTGSTDCHKPLAGVTADGCLEIIDGDTCAPTIRLRTTGVTPVNNACIRINACGLVEWVSPTFPHDCLPIFEPCSPCSQCGGSGGSGASAASAVSYAAGGNLYVLGPTVQDALTQVELAVQALFGAHYVESVGQGGGITITGSSANPVINLTPVMTAGVYDGFTVNQYGQITNWSHSDATKHVGSAPISVGYNIGTDTYTYSISSATTAARGAVQLVDPVQVNAGTVPAASGGYAVTWDGLLAFLQAYMPKLDTGNGITGSTGIFNSDRTLALDVPGLAAVNTFLDTDVVLVYTGSAHKKVLVSDACRDFGGNYATAIVNMPSAAIVASRGIASVAHTAVGTYTVNMSIPGSLTSAYIVNAAAVNYSGLYAWTYEPLSASSFELRFYNSAGALFDPAQIAFAVSGAN